MIKIYALKEYDWFDDMKVERFMWRQTANAYGVDEVVLERSFEEIPDIEGFTKVHVLMPNRIDRSVELVDFVHPENAVYIFGNAVDNLVRFVEEKDECVQIATPKSAALFGITVAGAILTDRLYKNGDR